MIKTIALSFVFTAPATAMNLNVKAPEKDPYLVAIVNKVKERYPKKTKKQLDNLYRNLKTLCDAHGTKNR